MARVGAVTLDLFGTLVDFDIQRDERPLVAELLGSGAAVDQDAVLATWVRESLAERARTPFRTVRASLVEGAHRTAREHGLEVDPDAWATRLEELWRDRPLREEAPVVLDRLDAAEVPMAVVTNLDASVLEQVLARTGLAERVPLVVCSEHARAYKPHPRPFRMALERLGADPVASVHVGDSPGEDRAGAKAAGMDAVVWPEHGSLQAALEVAVGALGPG